MALERIVHGIGNLTRKAIVNGLVGLTALGAGSMPAYAQQDAKYAPAENVVYVHCTEQKTRTNNSPPPALWSFLGLMGRFHGNPNVQKLGAAASLAGQRGHKKEVAREERAEVNVSQGQIQTRYEPAAGCTWVNPESPYPDLAVRKALGRVFAANYWKDLNMDTHWDANEFMGIKNKFPGDGNEPVTLFLYNPTQQQRISKNEIRLDIIGPSGERVDGFFWEKKNTNSYGFGYGVLARHLLERGGKGIYIASWSSGGMVEMMKFEIQSDDASDCVGLAPCIPPDKTEKKQEEIKD